ncbi:taurine ABC transporter substrate-binding protein [Kaistia geumhonensis]|uniref:Taurine transport system substrate-binding protein n=1 Tax=Kaistia geumhonensis TaxID=410839 RepID=A0ABU0M408_9HYPH|nr:taurine ABC transporter substrate-binding protein [Kaistia geumhonensis]MCX5479087.1 taurine ABC transporter substrate-binding protein [Kaistia geumhonensis]MDQ0515693.1 taurine transport system substrate-binding protein [Kaistia geumhonensis]
MSQNAFPISRRAALAAAAAVALTLGAGIGTLKAEEKTLTIAYQTVVEPSKIPQADGTYEQATGARIDWRKFDSGADVIAAIASGAVDIGYVGSSPLAAAASRELPIETIFVVGIIGESEALVARNGSGIESGKDLVGKKVAVPFVSTTHYSLLAALKHWGIDPKSVEILNLRPPEIAAAWSRGDIDAAYVWDPALGKIKENGKVVTSSAEVGAWGAPTFDAWIVRKDYAAAHPDVVSSFVKVTGDSYAAYRKAPDAWTATSPEAEKIARLTGAKLDEVPALLKGYEFPLLDEQASARLLGGGTTTAIADASAFLKEQGKIPAVLPDYSPYVTTRFVTEALAATN